MKQCNECRSYAVNIERDVSESKCLCDVCHWKRRYEGAVELLDGASPEELAKMTGHSVKFCRDLWLQMKGIGVM